MLNFNLKSANEHMVALSSKRLCAGRGYWAILGGFNTSIEQNPDMMASFYKESGHK
jgi:hypothetical protein